jgi:type IV pilus assembly protein PilC
VAEADSERELRDRMTQQGFPGLFDQVSRRTGLKTRRGKKIDLEKFLIFNQQFLTAGKKPDCRFHGASIAGGPAYRPQAGKYIRAVRDEVRNGTLLSEAFAGSVCSRRCTSPR